MKVPVELERRWINAKRHLWNAGAGASLVYSPEMERGSSHIFMHNGTQHTYLYIDETSGGKAWFHLHVSGGYSWRLRSKHMLRANLKASFTLKDHTTAIYRFTIPGLPEAAGSYSVSGSYIGLSMGYIFAR